MRAKKTVRIHFANENTLQETMHKKITLRKYCAFFYHPTHSLSYHTKKSASPFMSLRYWPNEKNISTLFTGSRPAVRIGSGRVRSGRDTVQTSRVGSGEMSTGENILGSG